MHIVIIEDEKINAKKLQEFILQYDPSIQIDTVIESVGDGIAWFTQNKQPDLIFSDIQLLDNTVFELFQSIRITCPVIFVTAYDHFALKAFELNSIAYLLKPFQYEVVAGSLMKFEEIKKSFNVQLLNTLPHAFSKRIYKQRFVSKAGTGIVLLEPENIACFQTKNGVSFAYNAAGKAFILNEGLQKIEEQIDPELFFRINRSEIVNINFIEKILPHSKECLSVQLKIKELCFITSSTRTPDFRKWINR